MYITIDPNGNMTNPRCENYQEFPNLEYIEEDSTQPNFDQAKYDELQAFLNPPIDPNVAILAQISALEAIGGIRPFRDYMLSINQFGAITTAYPNGKIKDIDTQISTLRSQLG